MDTATGISFQDKGRDGGPELKEPLSPIIEKYSKRVIVIHWLSLIFMFIQMASGLLLQHVTFPMKLILYAVHFSCGIAISVLTSMRVFSFFKDKRPEKPIQLKSYHKKCIQVIHIGFYIILLLLGFTGIATAIVNKLYSALVMKDSVILTTGAIGSVKIIHGALSKVFLLLLIIHVWGFLTHWIRFKENRLKILS